MPPLSLALQITVTFSMRRTGHYTDLELLVLARFIDHDAGNASWFDGLDRSCSGPEVRFGEMR